MEDFVSKLKEEMFFKDTTNIGDTILFLNKETEEKMIMAFAQVLNFTLDQNKKDEWWHVDFLFLDLPPIKRTITLQKQHFTGEDIFTMGGKEVFIKAVDFKKYSNNEEIDNNLATKNKKRSLTLIK